MASLTDTPVSNLKINRAAVMKWLVFIATIYGITIVIVLCLRWTIGERWLPVALMNSALHILLIPSLILLPLILLLRRWIVAMLIAPAFLMFTLHYAAFFLPNTAFIPPDAPRLTVFTYNLHAELKLFQQMADVIRAADADIVALQEMTGEAAAYFDTELADLYPYRAFHPFANYFYGRAVLSRYPITADYSWPETAPITVRLQRVKIDVNGFPLTLYNFHAPPSRPIWGQGFDFQPRIGQIADLLKLARQDSGAVLLMGDFNTHDFDEDYGRITTDFGDVFREAGWGMGLTNPDWTWDNSREGPAWMPLYDRLDYIFFSDDFQAVDAHVWTTSGGSDHRPVFAALALLE